MYAVTSIEPEILTRATLRSAELGFFGVVVYTRVHTPRRCGAATFFLRPLPDFRPGVASFFLGVTRPLRTSWEVVGIPGDASSTRLYAGCGTPGAGTSAAATITSANASACSITPIGPAATGSPNTTIPPAMPAMLAAVPVT